MTSDEFWNKDHELVIYYREAELLRLRERNHGYWLQGAYIYNALCSASPLMHAFAKSGTKAAPYATEPYDVYKETKISNKNKVEKQQREKTEIAKTHFEAYAVTFNATFNKGNNGNNAI